MSTTPRSSSCTKRRLALLVATALAMSPFLLAAEEPGAIKKVELKGKVVPLAGLVERLGSKLDADAAPHWLALLADDGKVYPLIKDQGARMFFLDTQLQNRPMRLTGRVLPGTHLFQVLGVNSYLKGQLHDVYYWCDICSIRRSEKHICECCGGPMELREEPVKK